MPVVCLRGNIQLATYRPDPVCTTQALHKWHYFFQWRSSSACANKQRPGAICHCCGVAPDSHVPVLLNADVHWCSARQHPCLPGWHHHGHHFYADATRRVACRNGTRFLRIWHEWHLAQSHIAKWHRNRSRFGIRIDHDLACISDRGLASQSIKVWHASDH